MSSEERDRRDLAACHHRAKVSVGNRDVICSAIGPCWSVHMRVGYCSRPRFRDVTEAVCADPSLDTGIHLTLTSEWATCWWAPIFIVIRASGLIDAAVVAWKAEPRTTPGGQPRYSNLAVALTLLSVFRLALRQTEGLIGSTMVLLGLDLAMPDHSTLSSRAETLKVPRTRPVAGPVHLLVDSTELTLCGAGEWLVEKHGTKPRRLRKKPHIGTDADTGRIVAATLTGCDVGDASQVGPLLDQVSASFTANGAYD